MNFPEQFRAKVGTLIGTKVDPKYLSKDGEHGFFLVKMSSDVEASVFTEQLEPEKEIAWFKIFDYKDSRGGRTPTWAEICKVKNIFWPNEEMVYINMPAEGNWHKIEKYGNSVVLWKNIVN